MCVLNSETQKRCSHDANMQRFIVTIFLYWIDSACGYRSLHTQNIRRLDVWCPDLPARWDYCENAIFFHSPNLSISLFFLSFVPSISLSLSLSVCLSFSCSLSLYFPFPLLYPTVLLLSMPPMRLAPFQSHSNCRYPQILSCRCSMRLHFGFAIIFLGLPCNWSGCKFSRVSRCGRCTPTNSSSIPSKLKTHIRIRLIIGRQVINCVARSLVCKPLVLTKCFACQTWGGPINWRGAAFITSAGTYAQCAIKFYVEINRIH